MAPFWTASFLTIRSYQGSGRSTTTSPAGSPRGGQARSCPRLLDLVLEQQPVDALRDRAELDPVDVLVAEGVGADLGADAPRVRRQHENARADDDRLLDRVRHEQHR